MVISALDASEKRVWFMLPGNTLGQRGLTAEGCGGLECIVEEGDDQC